MRSNQTLQAIPRNRSNDISAWTTIRWRKNLQVRPRNKSCDLIMTMLLDHVTWSCCLIMLLDHVTWSCYLIGTVLTNSTKQSDPLNFCPFNGQVHASLFIYWSTPFGGVPGQRAPPRGDRALKGTLFEEKRRLRHENSTKNKFFVKSTKKGACGMKTPPKTCFFCKIYQKKAPAAWKGHQKHVF